MDVSPRRNGPFSEPGVLSASRLGRRLPCGVTQGLDAMRLDRAHPRALRAAQPHLLLHTRQKTGQRVAKRDDQATDRVRAFASPRLRHIVDQARPLSVTP